MSSSSNITDAFHFYASTIIIHIVYLMNFYL